MDLSSRVGNTGSRLHFLCLFSTGTVEIRHFLNLSPLGFVSYHPGKEAIGVFSRVFYKISYEEKSEI